MISKDHYELEESSGDDDQHPHGIYESIPYHDEANLVDKNSTQKDGDSTIKKLSNYVPQKKCIFES